MTNKIHNLGKQDSVFNQFVAEIRDVGVQKDSLRFRRNLERVGELIAFEISKVLEYEARVTWPTVARNKDFRTNRLVFFRVWQVTP